MSQILSEINNCFKKIPKISAQQYNHDNTKPSIKLLSDYSLGKFNVNENKDIDFKVKNRIKQGIFENKLNVEQKYDKQNNTQTKNQNDFNIFNKEFDNYQNNNNSIKSSNNTRIKQQSFNDNILKSNKSLENNQKYMNNYTNQSKYPKNKLTDNQNNTNSLINKNINTDIKINTNTNKEINKNYNDVQYKPIFRIKNKVNNYIINNFSTDISIDEKSQKTKNKVYSYLTNRNNYDFTYENGGKYKSISPIPPDPNLHIFLSPQKLIKFNDEISNNNNKQTDKLNFSLKIPRNLEPSANSCEISRKQNQQWNKNQKPFNTKKEDNRKANIFNQHISLIQKSFTKNIIKYNKNQNRLIMTERNNKIKNDACNRQQRIAMKLSLLKSQSSPQINNQDQDKYVYKTNKNLIHYINDELINDNMNY